MIYFDEKNAKKKLKLLKFGNFVSWVMTLILFICPVYRWVKIGAVPLNIEFVVLAFANIILLIVSLKLATMVRFIEYQLNYFSNNKESIL